MTTPAGGVQNTLGVVQGETNGKRTLQLNGVADFTGATIVCHLWQKTGTVVDLAATVANGVDGYGVACGVATISLGSWINTATGSWRMRQQVTFNDGTVLSWPEFGWDELVVSITGG